MIQLSFGFVTVSEVMVVVVVGNASSINNNVRLGVDEVGGCIAQLKPFSCACHRFFSYAAY